MCSSDLAKWEVLTQNISYVKETTGKNLNAHSLWCTYNALNLMEFCDFIADSGNFDGIYWQAMSSHPALNVYAQTTEFKTLALKELDRCIEKYDNNPAIKTSILKQIREQLIKTIEDYSWIEQTEQTHLDFSSNLSEKMFHDWVDDLEKKLPKKKNMQELWPEIYELYPR